MEKIMFSVVETAKMLGVSKVKVYDLIRAGYLKAIDIGGLKVSKQEIDKFITQYAGASFKELLHEDAKN